MSKNPAGKLSFQHPTKIYKHYICVCVCFPHCESVRACSVVFVVFRNGNRSNFFRHLSAESRWKCWDPAVYLISRQFYLSRCSGNALADFCSPGTSQNVVDVPGVQGMGRGGWMCFRRKIAYNHITKQYQICGFLKMFFCTLGVVFLFKQFIS